MAQVFRDCSRTAYADHGSWGILRLWLPTLGDVAITGFKTRMEEHSMNTLSPRDLHQHVRILGWLYLLGFVLFLLVSSGVYGYTVRSSNGGRVGEVEAMAVLCLFILLALPGMLAGYGLLQRKQWGRVLALVVGFLALASWPLGTALGLYTLWVLLQAPATDYFAPAYVRKGDLDCL
jgi:hypothetical protein